MTLDTYASFICVTSPAAADDGRSWQSVHGTRASCHRCDHWRARTRATNMRAKSSSRSRARVHPMARARAISRATIASRERTCCSDAPAKAAHMQERRVAPSSLRVHARALQPLERVLRASSTTDERLRRQTAHVRAKHALLQLASLPRSLCSDCCPRCAAMPSSLLAACDAHRRSWRAVAVRAGAPTASAAACAAPARAPARVAEAALLEVAAWSVAQAAAPRH